MNNDATVIEDGTIILGAVLSLSGGNAAGGEMPRKAMKFGLKQILNNSEHGIPSPTGTRKIAIAVCDDNSDDTDAKPLRAARHLTDDLGVPAIIGGTGTDATVSIANKATNDKGVLLFSPSATGTSLSDLPSEVGKNLVWRTAPSDKYQALAMATYTQKMIPIVSADPMHPKIAIFNRSGSYGTGLAGNVSMALGEITTSGGTYLDTDDAAANVGARLKDAGSPEIAILIGYSEVSSYISAIESYAANAKAKPPLYILSDGGEDPNVYEVAKQNDDLRTRIFGTAFGQPGSDAAYKSFYDAFTNDVADASPDVAGSAGAYDIVYLLSFGMTHLLATKQPIDGPSLSKWLGALDKSPDHMMTEVSPGTSNLGTNLTLAKGSGLFNFHGASGELKFDQNGDAPGNIMIWCIDSTQHKAKNTITYVAPDGHLFGDVPAPCQ